MFTLLHRSVVFGILRLVFVAKTFASKITHPQHSLLLLSSSPTVSHLALSLCVCLTRVHPVYVHHSTSPTSKNRTPPFFWTTVEVSVGLLAACLPPLGPIIRRLPSPLQIYASFRHGIASYTSGGRSKRLSSVEHRDNGGGILTGDHLAAGDEGEMRDSGSEEGLELVRNVGFKRGGL